MTEIRPLLVSYWDIAGGAARATYRLHESLQREGVNSTILVGLKTGNDAGVWTPWLYRSKARRKLLAKLERLPQNIYRQRLARTPWSTNLLPTLGSGLFNSGEHDLVNLHWIGGGFIPVSTLAQIRKPIVWTMHDMWPFTGGCHYSGECAKYTTVCGACPQLASNQNIDLSHVIWRTKQRHWQNLHVTLISPSRWLADRARQSALLHQQRIEVIPNGIDTQVYRPMEKAAIRAQLGLPVDAKLLLFSAINSTSDRRKGYHLLEPALQHLAQDSSISNLQLVVIGRSGSTDSSLNNIPIHHTGHVNDEQQLASLYAAADLSVAPSVQDNLPNTVMEALACGTPTVAFNIGGMADMIEHQVSGYLAKPFDIEDLAYGISWILQDAERCFQMGLHARAMVEREFTLAHQANRYLSLFHEVLAG